MKGSAWGLSTQTGDWWARALCADPRMDPDTWMSDRAKDRQLAAHLCQRHCPVRAECFAAARREGGCGGTVRGGVLWNGDVVAVRQPTARGCAAGCVGRG